MLLRGQPEPCGELSSRAQLLGIGDGRGDVRCRDHTQARDRCKLATGLALGMPGDELLDEHRNLAASAHDLTDQYLQIYSNLGWPYVFVGQLLYGYFHDVCDFGVRTEITLYQ